MEVEMLSRNEHTDWALKDHKDRDYVSDTEWRFFEAIENPEPATAGLKELVRSYGKYANKIGKLKKKEKEEIDTEAERMIDEGGPVLPITEFLKKKKHVT